MGKLSLADCYAGLLEHWPHGLHEVDRDGLIQVINRVGLDWLGGVAQDEAVGKRYLELVGEEDRDRVQTFLDRAFEGASVDYRYADEAGSQFAASLVPIADTKGEVAHILALSRDITEDVRREQQLTDLETRYALILESAGEGIYGLDADGRVTFGNRMASEIVGWHADVVMGQRAHDMHHHSHTDGSPYPREECPIYAAIKDGEVHRVEDEVFWHQDGSAVPVEYTSTPILEEGKPRGAVVVFRDNSDRKEMERQRSAALEEVTQLKDQLELERDYLRDEINVTLNFGEMIGDSPALKRTLTQIKAVASTPANVLVLGESGVGKEMVARAIHLQSHRADKPLVKVNCASIPGELFESEFFGHVKGAFTGAYRDRIGRLQLAAGGTLFLDEIGEIPISQQGKLLRALQENEFERVGDEETIRVDVRVVAATNRKLEEEVRAGRFREDLFYRLSVFPIEIPPLRDRLDDVGPLAMHFVDMVCREFGRDPLRLTQSDLSALKQHHWPGNIRELKNVIERAIISSTGSRLRLDRALLGNAAATTQRDTIVSSGESLFLTETEFRDTEKTNLIAALNAAEWRVWGKGGAADLLGIKPSTLTYRMKTFGIDKKTTRRLP